VQRSLAGARKSYFTADMGRLRMTMRELSAEARLHRRARSLSKRNSRGFRAAALYGAFALLAAVVFGTLSSHPF
jgi:hypothetical protein